MTSREFCYWLQGFFEIHWSTQEGRACVLTISQIEMIRNHLALVFRHEIDPSYPDHAERSAIHQGITIQAPQRSSWEPEPPITC